MRVKMYSTVTLFRIFLAIVLSFNWAIEPSMAQSNCNTLFQNMPSGHYLKKDVIIPGNVTVKGVAAKKVIQDSVKKYTQKTFTGDTFDEAIEMLYKHLKSQTNMDDLAKSNTMGKFYRDIDGVLEAMVAKHPAKGTLEAPDLKAWVLRKEAIDEVKTVKFQIARKVGDLEYFKAADYVTIPKDKFVITQGSNQTKLTHMPLERYGEYVESWIHYGKKKASPGAKLFREIDEGSLGVLDIGDIRDITSYNLWPMYLKEHDMRHIHYGLTHPMALAAMMQTTRSKNHRRYVMMGGLYEGVDRVQYTHETALNKFFGEQIGASDVLDIKRNLDLEEAMLTLAIVADDDLVRIAKATGAEGQINGFMSDLGNWKPKKIQGTDFQGKALNGRGLDEDIEHMVETFKIDLEKSEAFKRKLLDDNSITLTPEEDFFMKKMNFQIDPHQPEIVIDGIRYKNDGRGHFSYGDDAVPIGIGDN